MTTSGEIRTKNQPAPRSRFRDDVARLFVDSLKANEIGFSVLLPDSVMHPVNELLLVYHSDQLDLIRQKIEQVNQSTLKLAENMMNTAVRGALKGSKI